MHLNFRTTVIKWFVLCCLLLSMGKIGMAVDKSVEDTGEKKVEKINITADTLVSDPNENNAEFIGSVKVVQGETVIISDRLKIYFSKQKTDKPGTDEGSLEKIIATGNVRINFDNRVAVSEKAVYKVTEKILILTGPDTRVSDKENSISGEKITLHRIEGKIKVESGSKNRVKAVILPGNAGLN